MDDISSSNIPHGPEDQPGDNPLGRPSEAERRALLECGPMLKFACENVENLDKDLPLVIAESSRASIEGTWSVATSQQFWMAFNSLCSLIKPVTIDSLNALHRQAPKPVRFPWWPHRVDESVAERSSRRYTSGLLWLLGIIIVLQLMGWSYGRLSQALFAKSDQLLSLIASLRPTCDKIDHIFITHSSDPNYLYTPEELAVSNQATIDGKRVSQAALNLTNASQILASISMGRILDRMRGQPDAQEFKPKYISQCDVDVEHGFNSADEAARTADRSLNALSILQQFFLPVLLGTIGALAYVLRNTSEQMRSSTFSTVTPMRNLVRIVLGALMGVVIGLFGDLSGKANLQPLAIAFLAGYGVEPVFSLFDGLIARLK